jgi:site-specific recombinase XerD
LGTGAHVRCLGKGRKFRCTPLRREDAVPVLESWLRERPPDPDAAVFPNSRGGHLSIDAVERLVAKHAATAQPRCPALAKKRVTPHVLRHSAAMALLWRGVDHATIALWLGHESPETTQVYLHADLRLKERALARTTPTGLPPGRYRPDDALLAFLESL